MATDGVKIIDDDVAHDVYYTFMDLYDAGEPIETIKITVEQLRIDNDDVDDEIFITAYALVLWKISHLDEKIISQVALTIQKGAFTNYLTQSEHAPVEGRRRQQILNRFWNKISQPNLQPRKRKSHKAQTKFVFDEGDVLSFQMLDGTYRTTILLLVSQHRGRCSYMFAKPIYTSASESALDDVRNGEIMGRILQPTIRLGFDVIGISHKDLRAITNKFDVIGHLEISPSAQYCGSQGGAVNFESFSSSFENFNDFLGAKMTAKTRPTKVFAVQKMLQ